MLRSLLVPLALVVVPMVRLVVCALVILLAVAALGSMMMVALEGGLRAWTLMIGPLVTLGALRWVNIRLLDAEDDMLA
ncbi:hypothetical protein [Falsiroseomonas sp.]|uniref:hypothetical protein n=1 Tax=Falsiroseomonas sp. TaxID=2870721 RepID=UPI003F70E52C